MANLNDLISINLADLKKWGYLAEPKKAYLVWYREEGKIFAQISIQVDVNADNPFMQLSYKYQDNMVQYVIDLVSDPSNRGTGKVWYFICPVSGKRARKLYFKEGKFAHRTAFKGSMYFSQSLSKKGRALKKLLDGGFAEEKIYEKHFTRLYKGKPTAKYESIMKKVKKAKDIDIDQLLV